ncbi:HU family DNA-binding protein (plasmid) [Photobacterium sp. CCB-ST2H9]|uniref:HU family DNA-binding protein n=1 Tax=Photobacterium sp. CCB-ST2H9 TaxID=2912855 RepID=UPI002006167A|nr:HU family DNA-binding protein [Photobacterium sp. CCB-ST2H9]UTM60464.1 HU family DNA-binding protein [Photobacterium sp. CCB-ST2H9]
MRRKVQKSALAEKFASSFNISSEEAMSMLKYFSEYIGQEIARGRKVELRGFGQFYVHYRYDCQVSNPRNKEKHTYMVLGTPKFKPSKMLTILKED